jgi:hypothetical protein
MRIQRLCYKIISEKEPVEGIGPVPLPPPSNTMTEPESNLSAELVCSVYLMLDIYQLNFYISYILSCRTPR